MQNIKLYFNRTRRKLLKTYTGQTQNVGSSKVPHFSISAKQLLGDTYVLIPRQRATIKEKAETSLMDTYDKT